MATQREQATAERTGDQPQPPNQGERYEQGERSQQRQYEQGDPRATEGEDPFHLLADPHAEDHSRG
ncbi:hypothetical protein ACEZCY_29690 [Streptacidiphilus sp. N1-12]|uniref:Uncharacterized protein n=2 Tax=Streptacidiphilus alkalitolerans TaxID=3342712 RepID=A0ABV6X694_9ACTN